MLHAERRGKGPPVVLLHGFTQTGASWGRIAEALSARHEVITIDAPGHGGSKDVKADLPRGADLMVDIADSGAAWVGYSMGGRFALHVALRHPAAVRRLVLASATAGIEDPEERSARRRSDEALAERVRSEGVERFVHQWLQAPLFATLPPEAARAEDRLVNTPDGLASSLRLAGTGTQQPLWAELPALEMPVLVLAGELDNAYADRARRIAACIGANAEVVIISGAGHACHLEQPDRFLDAVVPFLDGP